MLLWHTFLRVRPTKMSQARLQRKLPKLLQPWACRPRRQRQRFLRYPPRSGPRPQQSPSSGPWKRRACDWTADPLWLVSTKSLGWCRWSLWVEPRTSQGFRMLCLVPSELSCWVRAMGRLKMFFHSKQFRCPFIVTHITLRVPQRALKRVHPFLAFPGLACKLWKWAWLCAMQFASVWKCGRWIGLAMWLSEKGMMPQRSDVRFQPTAASWWFAYLPDFHVHNNIIIYE